MKALCGPYPTFLTTFTCKSPLAPATYTADSIMTCRHQKRDSALGVDYVVSKGIRPAITMFSPLLVKNLQAVKVVEQRQGFFASF